jgi:hypothetical protein
MRRYCGERLDKSLIFSGFGVVVTLATVSRARKKATVANAATRLVDRPHVLDAVEATVVHGAIAAAAPAAIAGPARRHFYGDGVRDGNAGTDGL